MGWATWLLKETDLQLKYQVMRELCKEESKWMWLPLKVTASE